VSLSLLCPGKLGHIVDHIIDFVHQVFDNTPVAKDATLETGDELVGINGTDVQVVSILITTCLNFS
jgi:C-terminal processing protease CtpA/Prc